MEQLTILIKERGALYDKQDDTERILQRNDFLF